MTLLAVAHALGLPLARHPVLVGNVRRWYERRSADQPPEAALRMADVPEGTRLLGDPAFPVMTVENVVMLPGPPQFFRAQFDAFTATLEAPPFRLACVYVTVSEDRFAVMLDRIAREYSDVGIGSYPRFDDADHRVMITFEGKDAARVETAMRAFLAALPEGALVRHHGP